MAYQVTIYKKGDVLPELNNTCLFHSIELFRIFEKTPGYNPFFIVLTERDKIQAHILATIRRGAHTLFPALTKRCEIYGTGFYQTTAAKQKENFFCLMLRALTKYAINRCFLIEFRNLDNALFGYKAFRECNYIPVNWLRIHNSLHSRTPEERLSPTRKRQIKRAYREGVSTQLIDTENDMKQLILLLKRNYAAQLRKHFPNIEFFTQMMHSNQERENVKLFSVTYKNKIIGGSVCVYSEGNAYLWFSGGLRKSYALQYPGIMAVWAAIQYAYQQGYEHMEFMDVGLPFRKHGYRSFILQFGGKQISTRRWFRFRWNWLNRLVNKLYS